MAVNIIREIKPMKRKVSPYKEDFAASIPVSYMKDEKHISISRNPVVTAHANRSKNSTVKRETSERMLAPCIIRSAISR